MPWLTKLLTSLVAGLLFCTSLRGQEADPAAERSSFKLSPGWKIELFASDPMFVKPIEMNWDNRNRLWLATSRTYPQLEPGKTPDDQVVILEDTTGTGVADKATVFAEHLFIPNAVLPGDGGAYVTNSTEILHFDEDPVTHKAINRRVVLSGFGTEDTHHIVHGLRWGYDGDIYFNQSIYIHSHVETPRGVVSLLASGVWRYDPRSADLSVFTRGLINPWGTVFDRWGRYFQTDGAGGEGVNYGFPGAAFVNAAGTDTVLHGLNPGSPKYCGAELLTGSAMPPESQGDLLTSDFRAHRIVRFRLHPQGSGFTSEPMGEFLSSSDPAFRPVDLRIGPDGALYIADWYNPIINHGEVDFRDPRRDHSHGRIWRMTYHGLPALPRPSIAGQSIPALLSLLKSPEDYVRLHAKLELRQRPADQVLPALAAWVKSLNAADADVEHQLLEALWTTQNLGAVDAPLLHRLLSAHDPLARAAAVRVANFWAGQLPDAKDIFAAAVDDSAPQVRLEGIVGFENVASAQSVPTAMHALTQPRDELINFTLTTLAEHQRDLWLPAVEAKQGKVFDNEDEERFALEAVGSPLASQALIQQLARPDLTAEERDAAIDHLSGAAPRVQANLLLDLLSSDKLTNAETQLAILDHLMQIGRGRDGRPTDDPQRISHYFSAPSESARADAIRLAGLWSLRQDREMMVGVARDSSSSLLLRSAAFDALAHLGGDENAQLLLDFAGPKQPYEIRAAAITAMLSLNRKKAADQAAELLSANPPTAVIDALLDGCLNVDGGTDRLAAAIGNHFIASGTAEAAMQYLQTRGAGNSQLAELLNKSAGTSAGAVHLTAEQMRATIAEMVAKGDPARGEQVFRTAQTGCYQCHGINGVGGFLAPDLGSIGASSPPDYIIDSILDPNKAIKDGYMGMLVATHDGDVISGIKVRQDQQSLVMRDMLHLEIVVPLSKVKKTREVGSLMPTGLTQPLSRQQFLDLARFVCELGKPGPWGQSPLHVARRWRVLPISQGDERKISDLLPTLQSKGLPAYSLVGGDLPVDAIRADGASQLALVQCQIVADQATTVQLSAANPNGLTGWFDAAPMSISQKFGLNVPAGVHQLSLLVNVQQRKDPIRLELQTPGSVDFVKGR